MNIRIISLTSLVLLSLTGCFEGEEEKVARYEKIYKSDTEAYKAEKKRCRLLSKIEQDADLKCRAVRLVAKSKLYDGWTDMGAPSVRNPKWD